MKQVFAICSVYIATIIGAGFATGQEVMTFFVSCGNRSIIGVAVSAVLIAMVCFSVLMRAKKDNLGGFKEYFRVIMGRKMAAVIGVSVMAFLWCSFCVMVSAGSTILREHYNVDKSMACICICILCFFVFMGNIDVIVKINAILAPIMIVGIFLSCVCIILFREEGADTVSVFATFVEGALKLKKNFFLSSLIYVSYNVLLAAVMLVSLRELAKNTKTIIQSSFISGMCIFILMALIWVVLKIYYGKISLSSIPMLDITRRVSIFAKNIYAVMLVIAIFTTAIGNGFGFIEGICARMKIHRGVVALAMCSSAILFNRFDFSKLVEYIYGFFGIVGFYLLYNIMADGVEIVIKSKTIENTRK